MLKMLVLPHKRKRVWPALLLAATVTYTIFITFAAARRALTPHAAGEGLEERPEDSSVLPCAVTPALSSPRAMACAHPSYNLPLPQTTIKDTYPTFLALALSQTPSPCRPRAGPSWQSHRLMRCRACRPSSCARRTHAQTQGGKTVSSFPPPPYLTAFPPFLSQCS